MVRMILGGLALILIFAIAFGLEIGLLLLVGMQYETWTSVILFILIYGVVEFVLTLVMETLVELKGGESVGIHKWWLQVMLCFVLMIGLSKLFTGLYIPTIGAVIVAVVSATLYRLLDKDDVTK